jgi:archaellum component FlaG (FlaF/FlaG flagellin family)
MNILTQPIGKGKKDSKEIQLKTYINFAEKNQKKEASWLLAVPGIVLILILAALVAKFAVVDRFDEMYGMQEQADRLQANLDDDIAIISSANELSYEFYHHTWTGMTDEEKVRTHRTDIIDLVEEIGKGKVTVRNYSVKENTIAIAVSADTLDTINKMKEELVAKDNVDSAVLSTVQKGSVEKEDGTHNIIVEAQLRIYLNGLNAGSN